MKYRTLVIDPPWPIGDMPAFSGRPGPRTIQERRGTGRIGLGYQTMTLDDISALPVATLSEDDAHLYLWAVNALLVEAFSVARAWGFRPAQVLVWSKKPRGLGPGGTFANSTEFVLFCRRGSLKALKRIDRTCWEWKRPYNSKGVIGSAKPEGFYDLVEQVSPGPYLELFARRERFLWDYWGNECRRDVDLEVPA